MQAQMQARDVSFPTVPAGTKSGFQFGGKTQEGWGPEWWGITWEQLGEITMLPEYQTDMTARVLVEKVIKPHTEGKGLGYALMKNKAKPLKVDIMVSHCWDEYF